MAIFPKSALKQSIWTFFISVANFALMILFTLNPKYAIVKGPWINWNVRNCSVHFQKYLKILGDFMILSDAFSRQRVEDNKNNM